VIEELSKVIKETALKIGFDACGITKAEYLNEDAAYLFTWLNAEMNGSMSFMKNNFEKRVDPQKLVPGCKSVVVVLLNYFPDQIQNSDLPKIAKYAYSSTDYHYVIKEKLRLLEAEINRYLGEQAADNAYQHLFVDSAPVLERRWAQKAGLGWIGKNKQLIGEGLGSFCFIGTLMLNVEMDYNVPLRDKCGNCTKCIDACPTNALVNGKLDARKCISYLTIEAKEDIPAEYSDKLSGYVVGCDICADVCPWNKKWAIPHNHSELKPIDEIFEWKKSDWDNLTLSQYKRIFKNSAINRVGYKKLKRNLEMFNNPPI
jgi:epoxyqueuosine reductase